MARDYRTAEVFSQGTRPLPFWLWLFAAFAIGGFVFLIYYLDQYEQSKSGLSPEVQSKIELPAINSEQAADNKQNSSDDTANKDSGKLGDFSFYKLLPKISVDVPRSKSEQNTQASKATDAQPAAPAFSYILQVASFKDFAKADSLKARLAFEGLEAKIEKVTLNGSDVRHRVRIGPIHSEREMNKIRAQLRKQQIEPIMLKVKG